MSRLETKFRLMRELGTVLAPVERLLFNDAEPNPSKAKIEVVWAQYRADAREWSLRVREFCTVNGLVLSTYYNNINRFLTEIAELPKMQSGNWAAIRERFTLYRSQAESALIEVPADDPDVMMPPQSPFQTYIRLLAICGTTTTRLQLFDPYLDAEVFDRYLSDVHQNVEITLVTEVANMRKARLRGRIVAISELVALERPARYRLLEAPSIHDRHFRADDKIYHLGGSAKDASKKDLYSITETDSNQALHLALDGIITGSSPWYEPGMPRHRRWCPSCNESRDVKANGECTVCNTQT